MIVGRKLAITAAAALAVVGSGCGFGAGPSSEGTATLTVTRDYGATAMDSASESDPNAAETVLRLLDRNTDVTTRYGGGFVQSIDGLAGASDGTRRSDWFFYVNGVESPIGSTQVHVRGGDRVWWDYRDWTAAMRVPAVVGSFPQPFAASGGTIAVDCAGPPAPCETAADALRAAGLRARVRTGLGRSGKRPRLLVGTWASVRKDSTARLIAAGPAASGVFARFERGGGLDLLDMRGDAAQTLGSDAGLLAATSTGADAPTWLVTGTDASGVAAAAATLGTGALRGRYALATSAGRVEGLPIQARQVSG